MKFVQTFWSKPGKGNSSMDISAGWLSPEYHWMSWALSCLQIKKFYKDVELITDERGKEILVDRLQLPYSSVRTSLEASLDAYPPELWSLAKIFSYSMQEEPFVHLDGDVFIWKPFEGSFLGSGLLAQNVEVNIPYYRSMLLVINKKLQFVPGPFVYANGDVHASNTGIFGGNNIAFIKEYCRQAFEFVEKNIQGIGDISANGRPLLNFIFEQYLLFNLAADKGLDISYFMKEPVTEPSYREYARLLDIPNVSIVHPVGDYKKRPFTCMQMARRLRKEYPDYYYRVLDACKKEMKLAHKFYHLFEEKPSAVYQKILDDKPLKLSNQLPQVITPARDRLTEKDFHSFSTDARSEQLFSELRELEFQRNKVFGLLNQAGELTRLYKDEILQYLLVAGLFANAINFNTKIYVNKDVVLVELSRKWELQPGGNISNIWNEEAGLEQIALWIEPELCEVNEMYLSRLEMILVSITNSPIAIRDVLQEARQFFDAAEIEKEPGQYDQAIINTIRHLLYSRILCVA